MMAQVTLISTWFSSYVILVLGFQTELQCIDTEFEVLEFAYASDDDDIGVTSFEDV